MMRVRMGLTIKMTISVTWKVKISQDSDEVRGKRLRIRVCMRVRVGVTAKIQIRANEEPHER